MGLSFKRLEQARLAMTTPRLQHYPKGTEFLVGQPKVAPTGLMNKLEYFQSTGNVEQAFLGQISIPNSGQPPHPMICLKLSKNSRRTFNEVSADLGPTIRSVLGEHELLDLFELKSETKMPISKLIRFFPK